MRSLYTLLAVSSAALLTACAGAGATTFGGNHAAHQAAASADGMPGPMQGRMHGRMQHTPEMQAFHEQMKNAKTPEERQALMNAHMKAMHEGMDPAKCMEGMQGGMHRRGG